MYLIDMTNLKHFQVSNRIVFEIKSSLFNKQCLFLQIKIWILNFKTIINSNTMSHMMLLVNTEMLTIF